MSDVKLYTFAGAAGCYVYEGDYKKIKVENESLRFWLEQARLHLEVSGHALAASDIYRILNDSPENP